MFITTTEWASEWGGAKAKDTRTPFRRLPFYCCAVSFTPFEDPVCSPEGHVYDIVNIVPYIQKFKRNPVTGKPLALKDLIKLHFHKNADGSYQRNPAISVLYSLSAVLVTILKGTLTDLIKLHFHKIADGLSQCEYHCPVLKKVFTEFTHIVAVKTTGNVFCYEAIKELNVKPKNWKELLTDEPFTRADIITIQACDDPNNLDSNVLTEDPNDPNNLDANVLTEDPNNLDANVLTEDPNNLDANVLTEFDHVKQNLAAPKEGEGGAAASGVNAAVSESIQRVLAALPKNDGEEPGVGSSKSTQKSRLCLALPPTFESTQK
ncbi:unnamed protein product [Closterium sp. NIES-64]|nr:unnamed protein product [Closterium sp. NIES-64]